MDIQNGPGKKIRWTYRQNNIKVKILQYAETYSNINSSPGTAKKTIWQ